MINSGFVSLTNSTVSGNTSGSGGTIHAYYPAAMAIVPNNVLEVNNSIIAGNLSGNESFNFDVFIENSIFGGDITAVLETEVVNLSLIHI